MRYLIATCWKSVQSLSLHLPCEDARELPRPFLSANLMVLATVCLVGSWRLGPLLLKECGLTPAETLATDGNLCNGKIL